MPTFNHFPEALRDQCCPIIEQGIATKFAAPLLVSIGEASSHTERGKTKRKERELAIIGWISGRGWRKPIITTHKSFR